MSNEFNKHGLSRPIPEPIKRAVRQHAGFGCVMCGHAIGTYDHIEPEFREAEQHTADGIAYLCATHHLKRTKGLLSAETVKDAMADPFCRREGFSRDDALDLGTEFPVLKFGESSVYRNTRSIVRLGERDLIYVLPPESDGAPYSLSAVITDSKGKLILRIDNNEMTAFSDSWDIVQEGRMLTIWRARRDLALKLENVPRKHLQVHQLSMCVPPLSLQVKDGEFRINGGGNILSNCSSDNCDCVFIYDQPFPPIFRGDVVSAIEGVTTLSFGHTHPTVLSAAFFEKDEGGIRAIEELTVENEGDWLYPVQVPIGFKIALLDGNARGRKRVRVLLRGPSNDVYRYVDKQMEFTGSETPRVCQNSTMWIQGEGTHWLELLVNDDLIARTLLKVTLVAK